MPENEELAPPWIAFPRIPWGSAGWRMGFGEVHWNKWVTRFEEMTTEEQLTYEELWPEQPGWEGFYKFIQTGASPPWVAERERQIAAAARPPESGEDEIREPYRIQWMLRAYLTRPKIRVRVLNYGLSHHRVLRDPAGNPWCLVEPREANSPVYLYRYRGELIGEDNLSVEPPLQ